MAKDPLRETQEANRRADQRADRAWRRDHFWDAASSIFGLVIVFGLAIAFAGAVLYLVCVAVALCLGWTLL